ncbi:MAG: RNA polymerase sigma factor [Actinomycetota bacterium]
MEGRPLEEGELIERAKSGDSAAYSALVKMHQDVAFRTAYVVAGTTGDAEDAAQEAFLKAYRALGRFREGASFRPWLLAIVVNEARNRLRSAARREGLQLRASVTSGRGPGDEAPSPEAAAITAEERASVLAAVNELEPNDRLVIALRYWMELTEKEMSEILRCRPGTVKSRLARATARLRARMSEEVADA